MVYTYEVKKQRFIALGTILITNNGVFARDIYVLYY